MTVKFNKEHIPAVIGFIEKNHVPENGLFVNGWLIDSLCSKIHKDSYDFNPIYLHFSGKQIDGIIEAVEYNDEDKKNGIAEDFCLNIYSNSYAATTGLLNMPFLKGKISFIYAYSPYVYHHMITYLGEFPEQDYIYYSYERKNTGINYEGYNIREIPHDESSENNYQYGVFIEDKLASKCRIHVNPSHIARLKIKKTWELTGLQIVEEYRRQGYASILTSFLTGKIIALGGIPIYYTENDNIASQRNAMKCGYSPVFRGGCFRVVL